MNVLNSTAYVNGSDLFYSTFDLVLSHLHQKYKQLSVDKSNHRFNELVPHNLIKVINWSADFSLSNECFIKLPLGTSIK